MKNIVSLTFSVLLLSRAFLGAIETPQEYIVPPETVLLWLEEMDETKLSLSFSQSTFEYTHKHFDTALPSSMLKLAENKPEARLNMMRTLREAYRRLDVKDENVGFRRRLLFWLGTDVAAGKRLRNREGVQRKEVSVDFVLAKSFIMSAVEGKSSEQDVPPKSDRAGG